MFSALFQILLTLFGAAPQTTGQEVVSRNSETLDAVRDKIDGGFPDEAVEILRKLPSSEMNDELREYEALALMNMGNYNEALEILKPLKKTRKKNVFWNALMMRCYFCLGDEKKGNAYLKKVKGEVLKDERALWLVCQYGIDMSYRNKVRDFWEWFELNSDLISRMINPKDMKRGKLIQVMDEGLRILGPDIMFNIGGDNELTFAVEGNKLNLFRYPYLVKSMPESLKGKWKVYPCKQPAVNNMGFQIGIDGKLVNTTDVKVSAEYNWEKDGIVIRYFDPTLATLDPMESTHVFTTLLELIIGEGPVNNYVKDIRQAFSDAGMIPLSDLNESFKQKLKESMVKYTAEPNIPYSLYESKHMDVDTTRLRHDVLFGLTRFSEINEDYINGENKYYNYLAIEGIEPIMLILAQPENMDLKEFVDFRNKVWDRLTALFDQSVINGEVFGVAYGASGRGYIDMFLYDRNQFIDYISRDEVLDELLTLDDGTICPTSVALKGFSTYSPLRWLRR